MNDAPLLSLCVAVALCSACGPVAVAEIQIKVREPVERTLLEEATSINVHLLVDDEDVGFTTSSVADLKQHTITLRRSDEDADAESRTLKVVLETQNDDGVEGLGRSASFTLPALREVQERDLAPATIEVPVLLGPVGVVARMGDVTPTPRTNVALCEGRAGTVWLFGGLHEGAILSNGYQLRTDTFNAEKAVKLEQRANTCDVNADGDIFLIAGNRLQTTDGVRAADQLCDANFLAQLGVPARVKVSGDVVWVVGPNGVASIKDGNCQREAASVAPGDDFVMTPAPGDRLVVSSNNLDDQVCAGGVGWVFLARGEGAPLDTKCDDFIAEGPDFVLSSPASAPAVRIPELDGDNLTMKNAGTFANVAGAILGAARGLDGEPVLLIEGTPNTLLRLNGESIPLPSPRDAIAKTVAGALVLFGGDTEGFDALILRE